MINHELMPKIVELYKEWCRLRRYSIGKSPIETIIDKATGYEKARMEEFASWFASEVLGRFSISEQLEDDDHETTHKS